MNLLFILLKKILTLEFYDFINVVVILTIKEQSKVDAITTRQVKINMRQLRGSFRRVRTQMFTLGCFKTNEFPAIKSLVVSVNFTHIYEFTVMKSHLCVRKLIVVSALTKKVTCGSILKRFIRIGHKTLMIL